MRVRLVEIHRDKHAELLHQWRQRLDIARFMYSQAPIAWADHLRWLEALPEDRSRKHWVIQHGDCPVGSAYLTEIDAWNRRAMFGMYVADQGARILGVGAAAEFLALEYAFGAFRLEKVSCEVFAVNQAPLRMHARMGFVQEGLFRRHARFEDSWVDVHRLSLLQEEWMRVRPTVRAALGRLLETSGSETTVPLLS
jgi:UDP-4-amino-4,6-dideoxy-N-acetyl-beta-L-altrosamine N-acetyltransferase